MIRAIADIALTCETVIINPPADKKDIGRKHLQCKITYVAQSKEIIYFNYLKNKTRTMNIHHLPSLLFQLNNKKNILSKFKF
jgi:hypothetical protein